MRIGFALSLPEQLDRFLPVARRIPGSRWVVPAGRWPSAWLDSHQWVRELLRLRGLPAPAAPLAELDLIVLPGGIAPESVAPWLAPTGATLPLQDERSPRDGGGGLRIARAWGTDGNCVGDPRLDDALAAATRPRARSSLGLPARGERPVLLLRGERGAPALSRLAPALARLRGEADLVVSLDSESWLRSPRAVPRELHGPGIHLLRDSLNWSELLALADHVAAEPGKMALDALALGKPLTLLLDEAPRQGRSAVPESWPVIDFWSEIPFACDLQDCASLLCRDPGEARELRESLEAELEALTGEPDGHASRRAAEHIRAAWQCAALGRALSELERGTAPS